MKTLVIGLSLMAGFALRATAGEVTLWQDNFTGADGTIVAPSANWGYTNLGVEVNSPSWAVVPRPDAADQYLISNNQLYCYVGPCTNDPAVYNKVMAGLQPLSGGTPVFLLLTNGQVEAEFELTAVTANLGNQWDLNQELKLALAAGADMSDPGSYTNMYYVKLTVRPGNITNVRVAASYASAASGVNAELPGANFLVPYPLAEPLKVKMLVKRDATYQVYTNGAFWVATNNALAATAMETVYPFFWHGKFNGSGGVVADGNVLIDNFVVKYIPEPVLVGLLLLGLAGWCSRRRC